MLGEEIVEESGMRKYAKLILPHVGLVLLTISYTVLGAFFFFCIGMNYLGRTMFNNFRLRNKKLPFWEFIPATLIIKHYLSK
jgi:hypothetical protein